MCQFVFVCVCACLCVCVCARVCVCVEGEHAKEGGGSVSCVDSALPTFPWQTRYPICLGLQSLNNCLIIHGKTIIRSER